MQPGKRRGARLGWEQLELLGPQPQRPQWSALPKGVRCEVTRLLARLLRQGVEASAQAGGDEEVGDE